MWFSTDSILGTPKTSPKDLLRGLLSERKQVFILFMSYERRADIGKHFLIKELYVKILSRLDLFFLGLNAVNNFSNENLYVFVM